MIYGEFIPCLRFTCRRSQTYILNMFEMSKYDRIANIYYDFTSVKLLKFQFFGSESVNLLLNI